MRTLFITAAIAALVACSPPAQRPDDAPPAPQTPAVVACSTLAPDLSKLVRVEEELAVAAAAADLRGGRIVPGVYDLTRAVRIGAATGWSDTRAVALEVSEDAAGAVTFNWAGAAPGGDTDRWTARFTETPTPRISYSCGRIGEVEAAFTAEASALTLRLPDGADGALHLSFARRT